MPGKRLPSKRAVVDAPAPVDAAGGTFSAVAWKRKAVKRSRQIERDWDLLRDGRGPDIHRLAEEGAKIGLSAGDSGVIGVLAVELFDAWPPPPDPLEVMREVDKQVSSGELLTVSGQQMNRFLLPRAGAFHAGTALMVSRRVPPGPGWEPLLMWKTEWWEWVTETYPTTVGADGEPCIVQ